MLTINSNIARTITETAKEQKRQAILTAARDRVESFDVFASGDIEFSARQGRNFTNFNIELGGVDPYSSCNYKTFARDGYPVFRKAVILFARELKAYGFEVKITRQYRWKVTFDVTW